MVKYLSCRHIHRYKDVSMTLIDLVDKAVIPLHCRIGGKPIEPLQSNIKGWDWISIAYLGEG